MLTNFKRKKCNIKTANGNHPEDYNIAHVSYLHIILLLIILIIALIIRIYPVIHNPEQVRAGLGIYIDSRLYHVIAYNLYRGNGFSGTDDGKAFGIQQVRNKKLVYEPAITRTPVYPYFIYMVYKLFCKSQDMESLKDWHKNWNMVRIVQCNLDVAICLIVFLIVYYIYSASFWPAIISAALYCFGVYNIYYTRALLSETLTTFLLSLSILCCVLAFKTNKIYWWAFTGIGFGLTILTRPQYCLFPLFLFAYVVFVNRRALSCIIKKAVICIICTIIVLMPWTLRNYLVFKKLIVVSTAALGCNLYRGTFESNKNWKGYYEFPDDVFTSKEEEKQIESLNSSFNDYYKTGSIRIKKIDESFLKLTLVRIRNNPIRCFRTWIARIPRLWYQNYIPMYYPSREASGNFFIFYFIFAIYAFLASRRQEKILMTPTILLFIYLTIIFLPSHIEPRFGVALMPGIMCMTGIGIWKVILWLRGLRLRIN